jgi:peroxiredoxin Q/BCP
MKSLCVTALIVLMAISISAEENVFKVGDSVPEFKLPYATQEEIDFEGIGSKDLLGKRYILAFYPADWSGGCTKEVCTFRDEFTDLKKFDAEILAISGDYVYSHREWAKHHNLPFKLLSDATRKFGEKLGVLNAEHGMFSRSVFVVGPEGKFEYIDYEYSVKNDEDFNSLKEALSAKQ